MTNTAQQAFILRAKQASTDAEEAVGVVSLIGDRSSQQDAAGIWQSKQALLAVVADGIGGHYGGELAAQCAVTTFEEEWKKGLHRGITAQLANETIQATLLDIHKTLTTTTTTDNKKYGKCAIVVLYLSGTEYTLGHIGDCRAYIRNEQGWQRLTEDDSLPQVLLNNGIISEEEFLHHPDQNILIQALGAEKQITPHIRTGFLEEAQQYLLCCDGVWNQAPPEALEDLPTEKLPSDKVQALLQQLVEQAVAAAAGKSDNATAIWVNHFTPVHHSFAPILRMILPWIIGILITAAVIVGMCLWKNQPTSQATTATTSIFTEISHP